METKYPAELKQDAQERTLRLYLYRKGIKQWHIDISKLTNKRLLRLLVDVAGKESD